MTKNLKFFVFGLTFSFLLFSFSFFSFADNVKEPNVSGSFYPADKKELSELIVKFMKAAGEQKIEGEPVVLVSPHAGYIYSGPVAAYGFRALKARAFKTVIILAPSHFFPFHGASVYKEGIFRTPLGDIEIDAHMSSALIAKNPDMIASKPQYFQQEHSLEVELPFLQESLKSGFKIVPVVLGFMTLDECESFAKYLADVTKNKSVLLVASTDMSHYQSYDDARNYDRATISYTEKFDIKGLWDSVEGVDWNVCGIKPLVTGLFYAKLKGADKVNVLKYANSGDTAGPKDRVVGYMSVIISETKKDEVTVDKKSGDDSMFTKEAKSRLLEIARQTIEARVRGQKIPDFKESSPELNVKRGVFVTLTKKGELRGCIGLFSSDEPIYKAVSQMAIQSSTHDYRFSPVAENELRDIEVEISVLSEPQLIEDWKKIKLGIDGVIVRQGFSSGVFLPQVAIETGWDLETFLGQLCSQKAGLPWDCYKDTATKIYTFQADVFSEDKH